jgi:hypothetical protein
MIAARPRHGWRTRAALAALLAGFALPTPAARASEIASQSGTITCGIGGSAKSGVLFDNREMKPVSLTFSFDARFSGATNQQVEELVLTWSDPKGVGKAEINGVESQILSVTLSPFSTLDYSCAVSATYFWQILLNAP